MTTKAEKISAAYDNLIFDPSEDYSAYHIAESPDDTEKISINYLAASEGRDTQMCVDYMQTVEPILMQDEDGDYITMTLYAETTNPTAHWVYELVEAATDSAPDTVKLYQSDGYDLDLGDTWEDDDGNVYRLEGWCYDDETATQDELKAEINRQARLLGLDVSRLGWWF